MSELRCAWQLLVFMFSAEVVLLLMPVAQRGQTAVTSLSEQTGVSAVDCMQLDVSSLQSVRDFADAYLSTGRPLHVLICNAGMMMGPKRESVDGFDLQFATNYLGHFLLCNLLEDLLRRSAPARVISVSSIAARFGNIDFSDLQHSKGEYNSQAAYSTSKVAQLVFAREFAEKLKGSGVTSNCLERVYFLPRDSVFVTNLMLQLAL